jgi:DNA repair protein RecN (Recombination protein N)
MITSLSIENFALIEKLSIGFSDGFSIITGETGAGKSILLGALGLALGRRADLSSLKNKEEKCIIEAHFRISDYNLQTFFAEADLDYDDDTIIRREILPSGKSRAFVNDSPVNLQQLQELGDFLIDIHSQHETRELSDENFQFEILDAFAGNKKFLAEYSVVLKSHKAQQSSLTEKEQRLRELLKEQDYNSFLLDELLAANLQPGDQENLEAQFATLNNVEFIRENLDRCLAVANDEQIGFLRIIKEFRASVQKIAGLSPEYHSLSDRAASAVIEFDDIVNETERLAEHLHGDPQQLELVNAKLQAIYNLEKKHQVSSVAELLEIQNDLDGKVVSVSELELQIDKSKLVIAESEAELKKIAEEIRQNRQKAAPLLSEKLAGILQQLGMPNVQFKIEVTAAANFYGNGMDELKFLFSANKGSDFGSLKKVASGGEMSRIMLAVKSILAHYSNLPTIIFDEIDTGVSGEIASKMGDIMKEMSTSMQVFAITHLPQIAAKGSQHYKVFKTVTANQTQSELKLLDGAERVTEIAQMLSGSAVSDSAINHAKALLN